MTEPEFKSALAEFTSKPADELEMTDDLSEIGVDSISIFEFMIKVEDVVGRQGVDMGDSVSTVQDLYDTVLEAAKQQA
ncbi:acyl carrier protein [Antribacter gilvus]|uniref:acyl carrier protein n=1 Tax=Antribacter gilvus TaxID=2304675 RepID=UPI0013DF129E|nr:acyl carrier protein [Antribacter gilvus]